MTTARRVQDLTGRWTADQFMWLARCCRSRGKHFSATVFVFFRVRLFLLEVLFRFFEESKEPRGHMYSPNCWRVSERPRSWRSMGETSVNGSHPLSLSILT